MAWEMRRQSASRMAYGDISSLFFNKRFDYVPGGIPYKQWEAGNEIEERKKEQF